MKMILFKKAECSKSVQDRVAHAGASVEQLWSFCQVEADCGRI